ncbi:MAG: hypothetical protein NUV74_07055 [Candidatus Brocadiaceae bacterium]|nr:hypothetical protein [Candidatus Brocadiaceae bacterium]
MRVPPPVPLTEGDKGGGKSPYSFSVYSLTASAIVRLSSRRSLGVLCGELNCYENIRLMTVRALREMGHIVTDIRGIFFASE